MIAWIALAAAQPDALELAYQREYAYLVAERDALNERQRRLDAEQRERVAALTTEVASVQAGLLRAARAREALEDELFTVSNAVEARGTAEDRVSGILLRAADTLDGVVLPPGDTPAEQAQALTIAVDEVARRLQTGRTITQEPGTWFALDGRRVDGDITQWGQVAAWANGTEPLAPGGDGRWIRIDGGEGVYLFEGTAKRSVPEPEKTLADQIRSGGIVGFVILGLGAVGMLLVLLRIVGLLWVRRGARQRVVDTVRRAPRESREDHAQEALLRETPAIQRFSTPILVIAAVAPLLGLLGTVTGMIATFEILTTFGTGDPRMLSSGISEALVTTQLGLIVAIPMLLAGNLLDRAGSNLLGRLETDAFATMNEVDGRIAPDPHQLAAK